MADRDDRPLRPEADTEDSAGAGSLGAASDSLDELLAFVAAMPVESPPSSPRPTPAARLELPPGTLLGDRYRIVGELGRGGMGVVYEARDERTGGRVAVKLLDGTSPHRRARFRREVAALRRLAVPGLVQLRDEGVLGEHPYLVMDRIVGLPFPGAEVPAPWDAIAAPTFELLKVLARVHDRGIVHRDLKPENVLVSRDGAVTLLDLGLAADESARLDGLTTDGQFLGTPGYVAPEQMRGRRVAPAADLYAVGVMLFEALAGERPHATRSFEGRLAARLHEDAPPVASRVPDLPRAIADAVDALLARDPKLRPQTAQAAAARLRGETGDPTWKLPRLGSAEPLERVVAALRAGRSIDVRGRAGSGRTRLLDDAAQALEAAGHRVHRARRGELPFSALAPLVPPTTFDGAPQLSALSRSVERKLTQLLRGGAVLVVDDADLLDGASARVIGHLVGRAPVARACSSALAVTAPESITLAPLGWDALLPVFRGPDRVFHLQEDAARVLHQRTAGIAGRIVDELSFWLRNGLARWDGELVAVERDAIERVAAGLVSRGWTLPRTHRALKPNLDSLLGWLGLAEGEISIAGLALATGRPRWRVEAELAELADLGAARIVDTRRIEPLMSPFEDADEREEQRRHQILATLSPAHSPLAVAHALAASDLDLAAATRLVVAHVERLARGGRLAAAVSVLGEHLRFAQSRPEASEGLVESLLTLWVRVALAEVQPGALDRVLYELCRIERPTQLEARLESLVRAALALEHWGDRVADLADAVAPFDSPALERLRHSVRVAAARRASPAREERLLSELSAWSTARSDPEDLAALSGWLGRLRYRQGRFDEAARLQRDSSRATTWATDRALAQLNAASALLELQAFDDATRWASRARRLGRRCRHAFLEARAEWILRSAAYRAGKALAADDDLVDAALVLAVKPLDTMIALTEAAFARRAGERAHARRLATAAAEAGRARNEPLGTLLASSLAVACGQPTTTADDLVERALECPVEAVAAQALALLCEGGVALSGAARDAGLQRLARVAGGRRLEVLTTDECRARLGG